MCSFYVILFVSLFGHLETNLPELVNEFHQLNSEKTEEIFIQKYENFEDPSILAYVYALKMKQASYTLNPYTKLKIFNNSKKALNKLITENTTNIHLRYIRLMLQEKTPKILGFNNFITSDKAFLLKKMKIKDETDYLDKYIYKNTSL
ncbi:hypothetical protein [Flavicella sediminum]|uniref:hypothetical protein n=1 Tax=Flavicella sediminum TaxID=2585141 RepID=UPI0011245F16|nr:hypothetical protein [Flavicella sediminum]